MVMGAFSLVGTFVSRATSNCGNHRNVEAECASDITGIYGWMNVLGHHAAAMSPSDFLSLDFFEVKGPFQSVLMFLVFLAN